MNNLPVERSRTHLPHPYRADQAAQHIYFEPSEPKCALSSACFELYRADDVAASRSSGSATATGARRVSGVRYGLRQPFPATAVACSTSSDEVGHGERGGLVIRSGPRPGGRGNRGHPRARGPRHPLHDRRRRRPARATTWPTPSSDELYEAASSGCRRRSIMILLGSRSFGFDTAVDAHPRHHRRQQRSRGYPNGIGLIGFGPHSGSSPPPPPGPAGCEPC